MKIALCQTTIIWENKEANYSRIKKKLEEASKRKTELFLLPEMSFTGFSMDTGITKENDGGTIHIMRQYAEQYQMAVGFGWVKDCGEKAENHYTVVDRNGGIVSDYAKIHPFSYSGEDEKFQGGDKVVTFRMGGITFAGFICYDLRFPEIFQTASKTADVILVPANWPAVRREHWKCLLRARAIENQVYVLAVNCVGNINGTDYAGDSCVIDPDGKIVLELSEKEGIMEYDLENDVKKFRDRFPVRKDRREYLYCRFQREAGNESIICCDCQRGFQERTP